MKHSKTRRLFTLGLFAVVALFALSGCTFFDSYKLLSSGMPYEIVPNQGLGSDTEFEWYQEAYDDLDGTKLTDGVSGGGYLGGNYVGFRWTETDADGEYIERKVHIIVDLGTVRNIKYVRGNWQWADTANIRYPEDLTVSVSDDKMIWSPPKKQGPSLNEFQTGESNPRWIPVTVDGKGRYVKLEWTIKNSWYHISEIEVYGK